jgi:ABC-type glycerol-3-phosphate transport system substrate-binding protein
MYAANNGFAEARSGIYFNKRVLEDAGVDPESIYDMQANGTWTWDAWTEIMDKVQRDIDNDGTIDVYGCGENYGDLIQAMVFSNGGSYVKYDADGKFVIALEDANTLEALNKTKEIMDTYDAHASYDAEAAWDFYKEDWLSGHFAFYPGQVWECDNVRNMDDEVGFASFPVGPSAGSDYKSYAGDNLYVIPACYDADKAYACAFAYMCYFGDTPGYEDFIETLDGLKAGYYTKFDDTRAVDESVVRIIRTSAYEVAELVPQMQIGPDFTYKIFANGPDISSIVEETKTAWGTYIDEANAKR